LNALVREDIDLITEANKLSEAGTNYGRVKEIEARRKEIREIIEAAQKVPPSGYGNFKADLALQKQEKKGGIEELLKGPVRSKGLKGDRIWDFSKTKKKGEVIDFPKKRRHPVAV